MLFSVLSTSKSFTDVSLVFLSQRSATQSLRDLRSLLGGHRPACQILDRLVFVAVGAEPLDVVILFASTFKLRDDVVSM